MTGNPASKAQLDFANGQESAAAINNFVEKETHGAIGDLVPPEALDANTRLVLVNALYFKVPEG